MSKKLPVFSDVVTWDALTDNNVVFNNNGTFQKTYLFRGKDGSNMTEDMVNAYYVGLNNIFLRLKANYYIFIEQAKRETGDVIQSHFSDSLLSDFQKNREENLTKNKVFQNDFYLTICYRWPSEALQRAARVIDKSNKEVLSEAKSAIKEFINVFNPIQSGLDEIYKDQRETSFHFHELERKFLDECELITKGLSDYFVEIHPCNQEETLTYLHDCISDQHVSVKVNVRSNITERLKDCVFLGGRYPKLGEKYIGIVGIKDMPADTMDFFLNRLNSLSIEYRFSVRYIALDKDQAVNELKKIIAQHRQREKTILTILMESLRNIDSGKVDRDAVLDTEDAEQAYELLSRDEIGFGYLSFEIVILDKDFKRLEENLSEIRTIVNDLGFVATIEKDNATAAWLSTIPSNYENNVRRYLVNSTNFCNIAPMGAYWEGQKKISTLKI